MTKVDLSQDHILQITTETSTNEHSATRSTRKAIRFRLTGKESFSIKSSPAIIKNTIDGHLKHLCWNITTKEHTVKKRLQLLSETWCSQIPNENHNYSEWADISLSSQNPQGDERFKALSQFKTCNNHQTMNRKRHVRKCWQWIYHNRGSENMCSKGELSLILIENIRVAHFRRTKVFCIASCHQAINVHHIRSRQKSKTGKKQKVP